MDLVYRFCVQPRHWELEHSASDYYARYVCFRFCVQPRHWELEHRESDSYESMFDPLLRSTKTLGDWNTAQVTDMGYMFYYASAFNHDISSWTGSAATTAQTDMFFRRLRFKRNSRAPTPTPVRRIRARVPEPILDANWHAFVAECLAIAPVMASALSGIK